MIKKLTLLNTISAVSFFVSSVSLLFIPTLKTDNGLPKSGYIIAFLFWIGLLVGIIIQIVLTIKCKQMHLQCKTKTQRIPLVTAAASFMILLIMVIMKSKNSFAVVGLLFCTVLSLQLSAIIKRKGCLK